MICQDSALLETMKVLVNYVHAFELEYGLKLMYTRIKDMMDNMISSEYLLS